MSCHATLFYVLCPFARPCARCSTLCFITRRAFDYTWCSAHSHLQVRAFDIALAPEDVPTYARELAEMKRLRAQMNVDARSRGAPLIATLATLGEYKV